MSDTRDGGIWQPHSGDEPREPRAERYPGGRASSRPTSPGRGGKRTAVRGQRGYQDPIGPGDYPLERGDAEWPAESSSAADGNGLWTPGGNGPTPDGRRGGPGGPRGKKLTAKQRRRRKILKWTGMSMALVLVAVAAFGGYWWWRLNHNIGVGSLHSAVGDIKTMAEGKDAFGDTAMNILVMGTDKRESAADCKLGGDCAIGDTNGGNADVEMIVHLAADRSNMEIISVPRDTYVNIPACKTDGGGVSNAMFNTVNSGLQVNTGCQVDTIEQLTGLQIDHFIEVDFEGVVQMTDAVGGVQICTKSPVHDSYSHLSLPAGTSTVQGVQALELLRSRHGFGDGSDLEREQIQHIYLSSLIRKIKSQANFMDATNLLGIADTATKSLTVDPGLDSITSLIGLGQDLNKVPTKRIEFLTMPTVPYGQHLKPDPASDQQLFSLVNSDASLTAGVAPKPATTSAKPSTTAPTTAANTATTEPAADVHSTIVENGTTTAGRAATIRTALQNDGVPNVTSGNYSSGTAITTDVYYESGFQTSAETVAALLGVPASHVLPGTSGNGYAVTVVLGSDFTSGTKYGAGTAGTAPTSTSTTGALTSQLSSAAAASNATQSKCATGSGQGVDY